MASNVQVKNCNKHCNAVQTSQSVPLQGLSLLQPQWTHTPGHSSGLSPPALLETCPFPAEGAPTGWLRFHTCCSL